MTTAICLFATVIGCVQAKSCKSVIQNEYRPYGPVMCRDICSCLSSKLMYDEQKMSCGCVKHSLSSPSPESTPAGSPTPYACTSAKTVPWKTCFKDLRRVSQKNNEIVFLRLLEKSPGSVNCTNIQGISLIQKAARYGQHYIFFYLVGAGADLCNVDNLSNTILHHAFKGGNQDIVKWILKKRLFDVNAKNIWNQTALMRAADNKRLEMFQLLKRYSK